MVDIFPFKGIRYNVDKVGSMAGVATPPYDVISEQEQEMYYERHPNNIIRLDKGKSMPEDDSRDNPYTRAAEYFKNWLAEGILFKDEYPCLYLTTVEFSIEGASYTRWGLIARVRLEPFEKGIILPHEETYSKIKSERLELMKACHANFSHIFSVFTDKDDIISMLQASVAGVEPEAEFTDDAGHRHRMWCIRDRQIQEKTVKSFKNRRLFIADGHHRYETALNYRDIVAEETPGFGENHPANFIMMYLCAIEDEGLTILPTHRLLTRVPPSTRAGFIQKAAVYFDIQEFPFAGSSREDAAREMLKTLKPESEKHIIGCYVKEDSRFYTLTLKPGVMEQKFGGSIPEPLRELDVTVLTNLVLSELLGFDQADLDDETLISYTSSAAEAMESVDQGSFEMAFILNPPSNEQVRRISEAGHTMPRKTTFYYPKVVTGQVMNCLIEH